MALVMRELSPHGVSDVKAGGAGVSCPDCQTAFWHLGKIKGSMSLNWTIDSETRLITAIADGDVVRRDVETLVDEMASSGA